MVFDLAVVDLVPMALVAARVVRAAKVLSAAGLKENEPAANGHQSDRTDIRIGLLKELAWSQFLNLIFSLACRKLKLRSLRPDRRFRPLRIPALILFSPT